MMKLKYLLDNRELAMELLEHWDYDSQRMDILGQYRISSNAIYPFYQSNKVCFLRFSPLEEKSVLSVKGELDFMAYLRNNGLSTSEPIISKDGRELVECHTKWGDYIAVVFKCAQGKRLDRIQHDPLLFEKYGQVLGLLHKLSSRYHPTVQNRVVYDQQLTWIEKCLTDFQAPSIALRELSMVRTALACLPVSHDSFGLIHYDFELDNVFYDNTNVSFTVIDFDDAVYHWYAMDVERTLHNLQEELDSSQVEVALRSFLQGYQSYKKLDMDLLEHFHLFSRYAGLYQYARCLRATYDHLDFEPDWMKGLREHLAKLMHGHESAFGTTIDSNENRTVLASLYIRA